MDMTLTRETIRPMTLADAAPAADLLLHHDFGERLDFFTWAIERPTIRVLVLEDSTGILGTGVASAQGSVGWVGVIFVVPGRRTFRPSPGR